jgi:hypothetical protein
VRADRETADLYRYRWPSGAVDAAPGPEPDIHKLGIKLWITGVKFGGLWITPPGDQFTLMGELRERSS